MENKNENKEKNIEKVDDKKLNGDTLHRYIQLERIYTHLQSYVWNYLPLAADLKGKKLEEQNMHSYCYFDGVLDTLNAVQTILDGGTIPSPKEIQEKIKRQRASAYIR